SGMKVLHSKNIIHRDLKPQNLLLHGPLNCGFHSPYRLCLKIADFGVARYLAEDAVAETVTGTPLYMAPELLVAYLNRQYKGRYSANVDMWSVGVILYECLTGERPFKDHDLVKLAYTDEPVDHDLPPSISDSLAYLITSLLQPRPERRATFEAFFSNAFCEESPIYDDVAETAPPPYDDVSEPEHSAPSSPGYPNCLEVRGARRPGIPPRKDTLMLRRASPPQPPPKPLYLRQSNSTGVSTGSSWDSTGPSSRHSADDEPTMPLQAVVLKDYRRKDFTEIDLQVGDIITHIEKMNNGWWRGLCKGKFGMFPAKHVQPLKNSRDSLGPI
ncbi:Serine/threonine-protein kinase ULK2, partial [Aphelenchoides avenae]